jgi:hypothetical protein
MGFKRIVYNGILQRNAFIDFVIDLSRADFIVEVNSLILFLESSSGILIFSYSVVLKSQE